MHLTTILQQQYGLNQRLNKKLIIHQEYGQLGNILFRLANTLGFAIEHGFKVEDYTLAFCNYHDGSSNIRFLENYHRFHFFEFPQPRFSLINRIKWKLRNRATRGTQLVENFEPTFDLQNLKTDQSYELKGFHFSSGELVIKHRSKICEILKFRESEINQVQDLISKAKNKFKVLLGVHIRRNDYKEFYEGKYFLSLGEYLKSIDRFKSSHPDPQSVGVVVCSDDNQSLLKIQTDHADYILIKGNVVQDMFALSQCDYIIAPKTTTMSAWASYFGNCQLLQIDQSKKKITFKDFNKIEKLEPFNPFIK